MVALHNKSDDNEILSYGVIISPKQIILPIDADNFYSEVGSFKCFNGFNPVSCGTTQQSPSLIQLNENAFIATPSNWMDSDKILRISRYPIFSLLNTVNYFETIYTDSEGEFGTASIWMEDECSDFYADFNEFTQICGDSGNETEQGKPLIATFDNNTYLVVFPCMKELVRM
uniref:Uncharacterized protein n=1 Tax=Panagrolaimus superbus TaxID=310955 RepID=A0A914Y050_9BILA